MRYVFIKELNTLQTNLLVKIHNVLLSKAINIWFKPHMLKTKKNPTFIEQSHWFKIAYFELYKTA